MQRTYYTGSESTGDLAVHCSVCDRAWAYPAAADSAYLTSVYGKAQSCCWETKKPVPVAEASGPYLRTCYRPTGSLSALFNFDVFTSHGLLTMVAVRVSPGVYMVSPHSDTDEEEYGGILVKRSPGRYGEWYGACDSFDTLWQACLHVAQVYADNA